MDGSRYVPNFTILVTFFYRSLFCCTILVAFSRSILNCTILVAFQWVLRNCTILAIENICTVIQWACFEANYNHTEQHLELVIYCWWILAQTLTSFWCHRLCQQCLLLLHQQCLLLLHRVNFKVLSYLQLVLVSCHLSPWLFWLVIATILISLMSTFNPMPPICPSQITSAMFTPVHKYQQFYNPSKRLQWQVSWLQNCNEFLIATQGLHKDRQAKSSRVPLAQLQVGLMLFNLV